MAYLLYNSYRIWILNLSAIPHALGYIPFIILLYFTGRWRNKQVNIKHQMIMAKINGVGYSIQILGVIL